MPRAKNEGTIFKYRGRWIGAIDLGYVNGTRKKKRVRGATQKEVRDKLAKLIEKRDKGLPLGDDRLSVGDFLDRWLRDYVKPACRPMTVKSYETNVALHIKPELGTKLLSKLSEHDVQRFLNASREKGLAPGSVRLLRTILRSAISKAVKGSLISRNVVTLTDAVKVPRFQAKALTGDQGKAFIAAASGERLEALFVVAIELGLRQGEVLALRWSDVDFESRKIRVENTMQRIGKALVLGPTKTESSRRLLPLPAASFEALRSHRRRQQEERLAVGPGWENSELVFTNECGAAIGRTSLIVPFARILDRAKLPHIRFHDLRHSCATLLHARKVPVATACAILGHSDIRTTLGIYSHTLDESLEEARNVIDAAHR